MRRGPTVIHRRTIFATVAVLGLSAAMTQLALLREMLAAFGGNELILGILLGNWMLVMGLGAWLGRYSSRLREPARMLTVGLIAVALLPLVQVVLLRILRDVVFLRGAQVGLIDVFTASFVVLLPYCAPAGALLPLACAARGTQGERNDIGRIYIADSIGCMVGGAVFSFALVPRFDHFMLLCFPAWLCLIAAAAVAWRFRQRVQFALAVLVAAGLAAVVARIDVDNLSTMFQVPGQMVVFAGNSPYGRVVVGEDSGQYNFIENGVPMFASRDIERVEETVHFPMAQRSGARRVLLLSGGLSGTAKELLKYPGVTVDYVEIDPLLIATGRRFLPDNLADPRIRVIDTDGRRFVRETAMRYDVVIVDVPDPVTWQINRLYTAEFLGEVRRILAPDGVVSFALGRYASYVGREQAQLLASARATLGLVFRHAMLLPGGRVYFLASDGDLTTDIAGRLESAGISTRWMRRANLQSSLAPDRIADLARASAGPAAINRDFNPVLCFYGLRFWLSRFSVPWELPAALLAAAAAICLFRMRAVMLALFASGFAASGLETVLLLAFQTLCGSLYRQVGVIVTVFMGGLAVGALLTLRGGRTPPRRMLAALSLLLAAVAAALPVLLTWLARSESPAWISPAISLLTFVPAALVGAMFPVAGRAGTGTAAGSASRLYAADFAGAVFGALLPGAVLIPLFGLQATCWLCSGITAIAAAILLLRRRENAS